MRGYLNQRSKGSWTIWLELPKDPATGKRQRKTFTVKGSKREAEKRLADLQHQLNNGLPVDTSKITLREYLGSWLSDVVALRNRPRTLEGYRTIVDRHIIPNLGGIRLLNLAPADVQRMESKLRIRASRPTPFTMFTSLWPKR